MAVYNDDNINNNQITLPLMESLNLDGIHIIRMAAGFPNNWNIVMMSMWLGEMYDRVRFVAQIENGQRTTANTDVINNNVQNDCIIIRLPYIAFNGPMVESIHDRLHPNAGPNTPFLRLSNLPSTILCASFPDVWAV